MGKGNDLKEYFVRIMPYGREGTKKTTWALMAAAAGFNVHMFDGDDGAHIIKQLPLSVEMKNRINIISCKDKLKFATFAMFITAFSGGREIRWDDNSRYMLDLSGAPDPTHAHFVLNVNKMTANDVVVLDSWTSYTKSLVFQFLNQNSINVESLTKYERDVYAWISFHADLLLTRMKSWPCHSVFIAHEETTEITKKTRDKKGQMVDTPIGEQFMQIFSTSRSHAKKVGINFSDIPWFHFNDSAVYIDTRPHEDRMGKARLVFKYGRWEEIQFKTFTDALGCVSKPDADSPGCVYYRPGEIENSIHKTAFSLGNGQQPASSGLHLSFGAGSDKLEQPPAPPIPQTEPTKFSIDLSGKKG